MELLGAKSTTPACVLVLCPSQQAKENLQGMKEPFARRASAELTRQHAAAEPTSIALHGTCGWFKETINCLSSLLVTLNWCCLLLL